MKLSRIQLRRLIESVINEEESTSLISEKITGAATNVLASQIDNINKEYEDDVRGALNKVAKTFASSGYPNIEFDPSTLRDSMEAQQQLKYGHILFKIEQRSGAFGGLKLKKAINQIKKDVEAGKYGIFNRVTKIAISKTKEKGMEKDFEEIDIGRQGFSDKLMKVKMLGVVIGLKAEGVDLRSKGQDAPGLAHQKGQEYGRVEGETNESLSRGSLYRKRYHGRY